MKRIFTILLIIGVSLLLFPFVFAEESNTTITETEILDLLIKSSEALYNTHITHTFAVNIPEEYNTYHKMHSYFASIYTEDIADLAWEQSRYLFLAQWNEEYINELIQYCELTRRGTQVLIYSIDSNGIITYMFDAPFAPVPINYVWDYKYLNLVPNQLITGITGDSYSASANVLIVDMGFDGPPIYGYVTISFKNTENGWRISDSDYFHCVLNDRPPNFKEIDELDPFLAETLIENKLLYKRYSIIENDLYYAYLISSNSKKAHYYIEIQDNKTDKSIGFYDAYFEKIDGQWTLVGGGVYELANGNDNAKPIENPYTGNSSIIPLILIMIVSLSTACFIAYRKKHLIDSEI